MFRSGAAIQATAPAAFVVIVRSVWKPVPPAERAAITIRAPVMGAEPSRATKRIVTLPPATIDVAVCPVRCRSAGLATANSHSIGPATFPARSATVTETVCTPAARLPGV